MRCQAVELLEIWYQQLHKDIQVNYAWLTSVYVLLKVVAHICTGWNPTLMAIYLKMVLKTVEIDRPLRRTTDGHVFALMLLSGSC
jgi:hypothetical protein